MTEFMNKSYVIQIDDIRSESIYKNNFEGFYKLIFFHLSTFLFNISSSDFYTIADASCNNDLMWFTWIILNQTYGI